MTDNVVVGPWGTFCSGCMEVQRQKKGITSDIGALTVIAAFHSGLMTPAQLIDTLCPMHREQMQRIADAVPKGVKNPEWSSFDEWMEYGQKMGWVTFS